MSSDDELTELHPRFQERRAEVEDATLRRRNRKLIAVGVLILLGLLGYAATQSALLDVDEVRVIGAQRSSPEYFRQVADVELGTPILGLDTTVIEDRLRELPQIQDVLASASWRGVVTVEVSERLPVARIESIEGTVVIADDGIVIEVLPAQDPPVELPPSLQDLPEISGAMFSIDAGERVPTVLGDALVVADQLPRDLQAITDRVEITVDSLVLRVVGGGSISLGDARDLDDKFEAVRAFLLQVDLTCLDTLNVRAPRVPVIVRTENC